MKKIIKQSAIYLILFVQLISYFSPVYAQEITVAPTPTIIETITPPPSPSPAPETTPTQDWADPVVTTSPTPVPQPPTATPQNPTIRPTITSPLSPTVNPSLSPDPTVPQSAMLKKRGKLALDKLFRRNFGAGEIIKTRLLNGDANSLNVKLSYAKDDPVDAIIQKKTVNDEVELTIIPPQKFRPGKYKLIITQSNGETVEQDFTWGVLAINTHKSIYLPGEKADIAIAVLDEFGRMVCDASVTLKITNSQLKISNELSTKNGDIIINEACKEHKYSLKPDYETNYQVAGSGNYLMSLTAQTKNGTYTISDSFEVRESVPFDVERITATRIFPQDEYPVEIKITANQDFKGQIIETVPENFIIKKHDETMAYETVNAVSRQFSNNASDSASLVDLSIPFSGEYIKTLDFGENVIDPKLKAAYHKFGLRGHDGTDYALPMDTPVTAADSGDVILAGPGAYGNTIVIQHPWGRTYYGHLGAVHVQVGQPVKKGERLGLSGKTGLATGPHLHFGIKLNNNEFNNGYFGKIDPLVYLNKKTFLSSYSVQEIVWNVSVKKGQEISLGYTYDAPNISPQFYLLGPLRFESTKQSPKDTNPFLLGVATKSANIEPTPSGYIKKEQVARPEGVPTNAHPPAGGEHLLGRGSEGIWNNHTGTLIFEEARRWQIAVDAISIVETVTGSMTTGDSFTLTSWTPEANDLILLAVAVRDETMAVTAEGNGLTFTEIADVDDADTQTGITLFRAMGSSPTSGQITVTMPGNLKPAVGIATRYSGTDTSGSEGSGAIEAFATDDGTPGVTDDDDMKVDVTTLTANAIVVGHGSHRTATFTVPTGETAVSSSPSSINVTAGTGDDATKNSTWYETTTDPATVTIGADGDLSGLQDWAMVGVSIKPASTGPTNDQLMRHGAWFNSSGVEQPFTF